MSPTISRYLRFRSGEIEQAVSLGWASGGEEGCYTHYKPSSSLLFVFTSLKQKKQVIAKTNVYMQLRALFIKKVIVFT